MFSLNDSHRYYLCPDSQDMRKGFDTLSGVVRSDMGRDPLSGNEKLKNELLYLRRALFRRSSERYVKEDPDQLKLAFEVLEYTPGIFTYVALYVKNTHWQEKWEWLSQHFLHFLFPKVMQGLPFCPACW